VKLLGGPECAVVTRTAKSMIQVVAKFLATNRQVDSYQDFGVHSTSTFRIDFYPSIWKMKAVCPFETLVATYLTECCHNPGDNSKNVESLTLIPLSVLLTFIAWVVVNLLQNSTFFQTSKILPAEEMF
jgi:hypothetical protein